VDGSWWETSTKSTTIFSLQTLYLKQQHFAPILCYSLFTSPNDTRKETVLPVTEGNRSTKCHMIHHKSYVDCYGIELSKPKTVQSPPVL